MCFTGNRWVLALVPFKRLLLSATARWRPRRDQIASRIQLSPGVQPHSALLLGQLRPAALLLISTAAATLTPASHLEAATIEGAVLIRQPGAAASVPAQDSSEVGTPLSGAELRLLPVEGSRPARSLQTNRTGRFSMSEIEPGRYTLQVRHPAYRELRIPVTLETPEQRLELELSLAPLAIPTAEVIEVAERATGTSPYSNLTRQQLDEQGGAQDAPQLLASLPSITYYSENGNGVGYGYLTLRGFDQRRVAVTLDGVPQNDPEDHNVYWINLADQLDSLEDIQVQRGAGATFSGPPAIGGAIRLSSRRLPADPLNRITLGYGTYAPTLDAAPSESAAEPAIVPCNLFDTQSISGEASTGLIADHYVLYVRAAHECSGGYRVWSWARTFRGYVAGAWYGSKSSLKLQVFGGPQYDALSYMGISKDWNRDPILRRTNYGAPASGRTGDIELFGQTHVYATHTWEPDSTFALNQTLYYISGIGYFDFDGSWGDPYYYRMDQTEFPQYYLDPSDTNYEAIPEDTMIRAFVDNRQVGWSPHVKVLRPKLELHAGAELRHHQSLHWGRIQQGSFPTNVQVTLVGPEADRHYYEYEGGKDTFGPYLNLRVPFGQLQTEANLQGIYLRYQVKDHIYTENSFEKAYGFLNGRLGLRYTVSAPLQLYFSLGSTQREPRLKELYDADYSTYGYTPDPERVQPEWMRDVEVGLQLTQERFRLGLNGYYMDFINAIVPTGGFDVFGLPYYGNASQAVHMGLEAEGAARLLPSLDLTGNVSRSHHRYTHFMEALESGETISRAGNPIPGSPDWIGHVRLSWRHRGILAALEAKAASRQYVDNSGDLREDGTPANGALTVDPYAYVNAQLAYTAPLGDTSRQVRFSLDIQNLLNQQLLLAGQGADNFFPMASRALFFQVRYEASPGTKP